MDGANSRVIESKAAETVDEGRVIDLDFKKDIVEMGKLFGWLVDLSQKHIPRTVGRSGDSWERL